MLRALSKIAGSYPEVEWAVYCTVDRDNGSKVPTVGLQLLDDFQDNIPEIIGVLCDKGREFSVDLQVWLVDDPELLREAREKAIVFYPWTLKQT
ncbi:MAG: hypothetical protein R3A47_00755 [Polyangiales bacterium]